MAHAFAIGKRSPTRVEPGAFTLSLQPSGFLWLLGGDFDASETGLIGKGPLSVAFRQVEINRKKYAHAALCLPGTRPPTHGDCLVHFTAGQPMRIPEGRSVSYTCSLVVVHDRSQVVRGLRLFSLTRDIGDLLYAVAEANRSDPVTVRDYHAAAVSWLSRQPPARTIFDTRPPGFLFLDLNQK